MIFNPIEDGSRTFNFLFLQVAFLVSHTLNMADISTLQKLQSTFVYYTIEVKNKKIEKNTEEQEKNIDKYKDLQFDCCKVHGVLCSVYLYSDT